MDEDCRPFRERLELRITQRRLRDFFDACDKLPEMDQRVLYEEIRTRVPGLLVELPAVGDVTPAKFSERCRELATTAPNDKVRNALLTIARICEAEAIDETVRPDPGQKA